MIYNIYIDIIIYLIFLSRDNYLVGKALADWTNCDGQTHSCPRDWGALLRASPQISRHYMALRGFRGGGGD